MTNILFLDDGLKRCEIFRSRYPNAVIVHTAAECIDVLKWSIEQKIIWDEVSLDHDLNGESYCDPGRDDTGMEVVRWVCLNKPDVFRFTIHSCNHLAAPGMVRALEAAGYLMVEAIPFFRFVDDCQEESESQ